MSLPYLHPFLGLSNGLNTLHAAAGGGVGGWKELGRTTLGSDTSAITISSLATKRYNMILGSPITNASGFANAPTFRLGNSSLDTGSNYASRTSYNGGADITVVNQSSARFMHTNEGYTNEPLFFVAYITNYSTKEKLIQGHYTNRGSSGSASNAPDQRSEFASKWANTSNAFDILSFFDLGGNNCKSGSEVVVLGWDPADTHTNNFWQELASVSGTGSSTTLSSGTITAKKYLWIQAYSNGEHAGGEDIQLTFNNDTGSNYAYRRSINGGADATAGSQNYLHNPMAGDGIKSFMNMFIVNNSANEKLCINHLVERGTAGAGNTPNRREHVFKWANTSAQITEIDLNYSGSSNWGTSSILKIWGSD